jgi:nicotinamidase-related amidase
MAAISRLIDYKERFSTPTLVLVDLHEGHGSGPARPDAEQLSAALETCRGVLACARRQNLPVAFVRQVPFSPSFLSTCDYPPWISGIAPGRSDMIFERALPSCYASSEFAQMAARSSELVLAGLFGETTCLSTLVEGRYRNHRFTFLTDASCSRGRDATSARKMHNIVVELAALYGKACTAQSWTEQLSIRAGLAR